MKRIFKFFYASPRDLNLQTMTVAEIAEKMKPTDEQSLPLPWEFASAIREILAEEQKKSCVDGIKNGAEVAS